MTDDEKRQVVREAIGLWTHCDHCATEFIDRLTTLGVVILSDEQYLTNDDIQKIDEGDIDKTAFRRVITLEKKEKELL